MDTYLIKIILIILGSVLGWAYFIGRFIKSQEEQKETIKENKTALQSLDKRLNEAEEKLIKQFREALYKVDGSVIYTSKKEFFMATERLQQNFIEKVEGVKVEIVEIKGKIESEREKRIQEMISISTFMGRIEQAFSDVRDQFKKMNGVSE